MNWWAKFCSSTVSTICLLVLITSCKKEGDFNLGNSPGNSVGVQYTDTLTIVNETFLLNDSIISARPAYLSFGGYADPGVTGATYAEAYASLTLGSSYVDYTGVTIDSSNLYMYYADAYGDTLATQDFAVHQITTQMDISVPYQTTTSFVTYDPTAGGSKSGVKVRPSRKNTMSIPLTNTFATTILTAADDRSNTDFNSNFYGLVIKSNNNSTGSVIRSAFTSTDPNQLAKTRLIVYFKRGAVKDSASFYLMQSTASFNRVITDRSGTSIASLVYNGDNISDAATSNKCYIQTGTGVVTKITIPYLQKLATIDGSSVIINKAILIAPIEDISNATYWPVSDVGLLELNPDNTYKYRYGQLSYVPGSVPNNMGVYPNASASAVDTTSAYRFDITRYIQFLLTGKYTNDGFVMNPLYNSYYTNRTVLNSANGSTKKMRLEIYYTKVN